MTRGTCPARARMPRHRVYITSVSCLRTPVPIQKQRRSSAVIDEMVTGLRCRPGRNGTASVARSGAGGKGVKETTSSLRSSHCDPNAALALQDRHRHSSAAAGPQTRAMFVRSEQRKSGDAPKGVTVVYS